MSTLFLSPHLDDVALSCGGQIARLRREGQSRENESREGQRAPIVLTVFAGDEPGPEHRSELANTFHRSFGIDSGVAVARREEDRQCCERLGAEPRYWSFPDAIYRRDPESLAPLYPDTEALFGPPHPGDGALVEELAQRLEELAQHLNELERLERVTAPLAVGGHIDHRVLRLASERAFGESLELYEDFPYVCKWGALRRTLRRSGGSWRSRVIPLADADIAVKLEALTAYESQRHFFGGFAKLHRQVRRYSRRVGGERVWTHRER